MRRLLTSLVTLSGLLVAVGCAHRAPEATVARYSCAGGQRVTVHYLPDARAIVYIAPRVIEMRRIDAPLGARYRSTQLLWQVVPDDHQTSGTLFTASYDGTGPGQVVERCVETERHTRPLSPALTTSRWPRQAPALG